MKSRLPHNHRTITIPYYRVYLDLGVSVYEGLCESEYAGHAVLNHSVCSEFMTSPEYQIVDKKMLEGLIPLRKKYKTYGRYERAMKKLINPQFKWSK